MIAAVLPLLLSLTATEPASHEAVVEALVERHNAHDVSGMVELMAEDLRISEIHTGAVFEGSDEIGSFWQQRFDTLPHLEIIIEHRVTVGNRVVDHEIYCEQERGQPCQQIISIYTVEDGLITAIDLVQDPNGSTVADPRGVAPAVWQGPLIGLGIALVSLLVFAMLTSAGRGLVFRLIEYLKGFQRPATARKSSDEVSSL